MKFREGDQALPIPNGARDVQSQVIDDIVARRQVGIERYGTQLQPHNGRDALRDLYEELLDACCYIKQLIIERKNYEPDRNRAGEEDAGDDRLP